MVIAAVANVRLFDAQEQQRAETWEPAVLGEQQVDCLSLRVRHLLFPVFAFLALGLFWKLVELSFLNWVGVVRVSSSLCSKGAQAGGGTNMGQVLEPVRDYDVDDAEGNGTR